MSILLDSCSTGNIISNPKLLHDFFKAPVAMPVHCNAGTILLTHQAYFGSYPEPVWFHPKGIANIMSLNNVQSYYHITYNNHETNSFFLHTKDQDKIAFRPCGRGLYQAPISLTSGRWYIPSQARPTSIPGVKCSVQRKHDVSKISVCGLQRVNSLSGYYHN